MFARLRNDVQASADTIVDALANVKKMLATMIAAIFLLVTLVMVR